MSYHTFVLDIGAIFSSEHSVSVGPMEPQGFTFVKKYTDLSLSECICWKCDICPRIFGRLQWCHHTVLAFIGPGDCPAAWRSDVTGKSAALFGLTYGEFGRQSYKTKRACFSKDFSRNPGLSNLC